MKKMKKQNAQQQNAKHNVHKGAGEENVVYSKAGYMNVNPGNEGVGHHKQQGGQKHGLGAYPKQEKGASEKHHEATKEAGSKQNWGEHSESSKKWNNKK